MVSGKSIWLVRPPSRNYRVVKYRPLPESSIQKFGEWIVGEGWDSISDKMSPTEQTAVFEKLINTKLNQFCPEKEIKLSSQDKPFITAELRKIKRQKSREYVKNGKSEKYKKLDKLFETKYKSEAEKYLQKNLDALRETNPGQAYHILKKMGAQPGDCIDANNTFTLSNHEDDNLSEEKSAERIAEHFAAISQEFPPLDVSQLPDRVQTKLDCVDSPPPSVSEYDTYLKIRAAKKPSSGLPSDLPKQITQEFAPELAKPAGKSLKILSKLVNGPHSGSWNMWSP